MLTRAVAFSAHLIVPFLALASVGCGDVQFIPSPYTPQKVEAIYSEQEDITIVRWRVSATPPLDGAQFQLLGPNGYETVDFSRSVFPGGVAPCQDGHGGCVQYVVRGQLSTGGAHPVRAVHTEYGVLPGGPATASTTPETFSLTSFFHTHNDTVYVSISDAVAASGPYLFPRSYERAMWPTTGLCVSDSSPAGVSFSPLDASGGFPPEQPLTEMGMYCVASRPLPADGGPRVMKSARIQTLPEVETMESIFEPPIEQAPIVYQIVLDLGIPVADRCASAIQTIESLVAEYLQAGSVPVRKLPTINLALSGSAPGGATSAGACTQNLDRSFDATTVAQNAKNALSQFPEVQQQFHFLYFNNTSSPLPPPLTESLQSLFTALQGSPPGHQLKGLFWLFNPGEAMLANLDWGKRTVWITYDDPTFEQALSQYALPTLPYTTQTHDPSSPVALLTADEAASRAGQMIKICNASPAIQPFSLKNRINISGTVWTIAADDPPAYLVTLPNQTAVPASSFVESKAIVDYQICTRYCTDHPYVDQAGAGETSWSASPSCASKDD